MSYRVSTCCEFEYIKEIPTASNFLQSLYFFVKANTPFAVLKKKII